MTREEAIKMAKADLKCMKRDTSGQDEMCNSHKCDECSLNYERGNIGEQKEWLRLAIKALEQKPCEDAVSRKAVHDMLENLPVTVENKWFNWLQKACIRLAELPPVTPQEPRWIPVSERLPDEGYSVLVMRITDDNYKYMRVATYQGDCWMDDTDKFNKPNPHKVIAWMPLPEPYKAESEGEE